MKTLIFRFLIALLLITPLIAGAFPAPARAATYGDVVISEIMYDPIGAEPENTEWVELYNPGSVAVDISGWVLTDDANYPGGTITEGYCTIPESTSIPAGGFLVISQAALTEINGEVVCTPSGTFELNNAGDQLALFSAAPANERIFGSLVVAYPDSAPTNSGDAIGLHYPMAGWSGASGDWAVETTDSGATNYRYHTAGAANDGWSGYVLTNHIITADGTVSEWQANGEQLGSTDGVDFYVTWDADYIYVGMVGGDTSNNKYNVLIDTDPLDSGVDNSGNANVDYCGATFADDGKADYAIQLYPTGTAYAQASGASWDAWTPAGSGGNRGTGQVEFYIQKSDLGLTSGDAVGFYLYACNSSNQVWAAWPPENEVNTGSTDALTTRVVFENTYANRAPRYEGSMRGSQTMPANVVGQELFFDDVAGTVDYYARLYVTTSGGVTCTVKITTRGNALATRLDGGLRRSYDITPQNCTGLAATITLKFNDGSMSGAPDEFRGASANNTRLYRWDGTAWVSVGSAYNSTNKTVYTTAPQTTFSPWTAGDTTAGSLPTAITLDSMRAVSHGGLPASVLLLVGMSALSGFILWRRRI